MSVSMTRGVEIAQIGQAQNFQLERQSGLQSERRKQGGRGLDFECVALQAIWIAMAKDVVLLLDHATTISERWLECEG